MFIALTLRDSKDLILVNTNEIETIKFDTVYGSGKEAVVFLKNNSSPVLLADTMMDIVKGLVQAEQVIKPIKSNDKSRII